MATLFIAIIYLSFISLGIPDSLLGSAWPAMRPDLEAPFGFAGALSMVIAGGTIVSSLASGSLVLRFGTGTVTLVSCCLTAGALTGFSVAPSPMWLIALAVPLGLGAGAIDAALNHYVAENYEARHMNWLHCFWGVGATLGPMIMSYYIADHHSWRAGYSTVSLIQFALAIVLLVTLPLWKQIAAIRHEQRREILQPRHSEESGPTSPAANVLRIRGVKHSLAAFLFYCGIEASVGLWGASYLVGAREMTAESAAGWVSLYYGGITAGRLITGFISFKVHNRLLIRGGQLIAIAGGLLLMLPASPVCLTGLILIGLGLAPVYPGLLHETPARFGSENAAKLMGYQMAVAYTGMTLLPPLIGVWAAHAGIRYFPFVALALLLILWLSTEKVNRILKPRSVNAGSH